MSRISGTLAEVMTPTDRIRELRADEIHLCAAGGYMFFEEAKLPGKFEPEVFERKIGASIKAGRGVLFGWFGPEGEIRGALCALLGGSLFNDDMLAVEVLWYVIPEYRNGMGGIRLLEAFEGWAREKKASYAAMIHLEGAMGERVKKLFERRGYQLIESHYLKGLCTS